MMSNVIHAKEAEFNELIQKEELVLVDFFATWCGPCKMLAPEIEKLADELEGKAKILKVDVDREVRCSTDTRGWRERSARTALRRQHAGHSCVFP